MIALIVGAFACLALGILLIGIAAVKEAFTPTRVHRTEIGSVAVEETTCGVKAPARVGRV